MDFDIDKEKITIEKDGQEVNCDILFTFDCEDTNKSYIGYTDNIIDKNGRKNIYISSFDPFNGPEKLEEITDKEEIKMIKSVLQEIDSKTY